MEKGEKGTAPAVTFAYVRGLNFQRIFKLLKPLVFLYRAPSSSSSSSLSSPPSPSSSSFAFRRLPLFFAFSFLFAHFARQTPACTRRETSVQSTEMKRRGRGSSGINPSVRPPRKAGAPRSASTSVISIYRRRNTVPVRVW